MDPAIPDELAGAAEGLERRFDLLRVPSHKVPQSEWDALPEPIRRHVPAWFSGLLTRFRLAGGVLEYRDFKQSYARQFGFFPPAGYATELAEGGDFEPLPRFGFVPIAYESDGSIWVTKIADGPLSKVYFLDHSDWDGGEPTLRNGLVFASTRLSLLLASMGVSEVSYYESPGGITSLIWHEER